MHLGNYLLTVTLINTERRGASQVHWHQPFLQVSSSGRRPSSAFGVIGVKRLLLILAVGGLAAGLMMAERIQMSEHAGEEAPAK